MRATRRAILAGGSLVFSAAAASRFPAAAQQVMPAGSSLGTSQNADSMADLDRQFIYQRAVEAVIWSMPAMSDVFFRESLFRDFGMKPGDVMVMSKPLVARHEVLTANTQVNYAGMPYDLTSGPLVVGIPPSNSDYAVIGEICDNWQAP
jgi:hypothetical protein